MNTKVKLNPDSNQLLVVTGGIASGKSLVVQNLQEIGFNTLSSDEITRNLISSTGEAFEAVCDLAPDALIDGEINRSKLAEIALNDQIKLTALENILHPLIHQFRVRWIKLINSEAEPKGIALEIPLYYEKKIQVNPQYVIATVCRVDTQKRRALERANMIPALVDNILARQVNNDYRMKHADIIINTDLSLDETKAQVYRLL